MTQLPHESHIKRNIMGGIRYSDGRIMDAVPYDIKVDSERNGLYRYTFTGFYRPERGLIVEAGIQIFGQWQWSPMHPQSFNVPRRRWSWRKFRLVQPPTPHTLTVTYTWTYSAI